MLAAAAERGLPVTAAVVLRHATDSELCAGAATWEAAAVAQVRSELRERFGMEMLVREADGLTEVEALTVRAGGGE